MLEGMTPPVKEPLCRVAEIASTLNKEDLILFNDMLADPRWVAETLSEGLAQRKIKLSANVIRKHRKKTCICVS